MTSAGGLSTEPSFRRRWYSFRASWMALTSAKKTVKLWQMLTLPYATEGWSVTETSSSPRKMANPAPVPQLLSFWLSSLLPSVYIEIIGAVGSAPSSPLMWIQGSDNSSGSGVSIYDRNRVGVSIAGIFYN